MDRADGMFVSEYQRTLEWFGQTNYLAYRVTDGMVDDQKYEEFLPEIKKAPRRIAVHNFRNHRGGKEQAYNFLNKLQCDPHCISGDYEDTYTPMSQKSAEQYEIFLDTCKEATQLPIISYAGAATIKNHLNIYTDISLTYGLWVVRFAPAGADINVAQPNLTYGGEPFASDWDFWQYGWKGNGEDYGVGSENVCIDVYNGTVADLDVYLGLSEQVDPIEQELALLRLRVRTLEALYQEVNKDLEETQKELSGLGNEYDIFTDNVWDKFGNLDDKISFLWHRAHKHWWK